MDLSRLQQQKTSERFLALEQYYKELSQGTFPQDAPAYVDVLLSNMSDSNFKVIELSLECVTLIFDNSSEQLRGQTFRIFTEAIEQFRSLREEVREVAFELGRRVALFLEEDEVIEQCESNLTGRNAAQKECTLQLLNSLVEDAYFERCEDRVERAAQKMVEDAAPEVRFEATELLEACSGIETSENAEVEQKEAKLTKTSTAFKQSGTGVAQEQESSLAKTAGAGKFVEKPSGKHNPQNSLFPPPENNDPEAQSETFGIIPPEAASYYSYKPLYCYTLFEQLDVVISPLIDINEAKSMRIETFRQYIDKAVGMAANENDWIEQMVGIQFLIGSILLNLGTSAAQNAQLAQALQENLLIQIQDINKTITSRRSVLQREMCILLEIAMQRFGKAMTKLADLLIDTCLVLLEMKGVYTEGQADSLIKSIIVHSGTKNQLSKVFAQLKTTKNPAIKAHCVDYLCLFMFVSCFDAKLQFWQLRDEIVEIVKKLAVDANQRVRVSVRAFIACCQMLDDSFAVAMLQQSPNLLKIQDPEAGFLSYDNIISISVEDEQFPGYYFQAAACHSDIAPLAVDLQRWRHNLVCADEFVLTYSDLNDASLAEVMSGTQPSKTQYTEIIPEEPAQKPVRVKPEKTPSLKLNVDDFSGLDQLKEPPKTTRDLDKYVDGEFSKPALINRSTALEDVSRPHTAKASSLQSLRDIDDDDEIDDVVNKIIRQKSQKSFEQHNMNATVQFEPIEQPVKETTYAPERTAIHLSEILEQVQAPKTPNEELSDIINQLTLGMMNPIPAIDTILPLITKETGTDLAKSLIVSSLDFCSASDAALELKTLTLLDRIANTLPKAFNSLLDFSLPIFVSMFRGPDLAVRKATNQLILDLVKTQDERQLFLPFSLIVREENDVMADAGLRFLALSARKYASTDALQQDIALCIPDVIQHFSSENASVRKSAVSCFIDLCLLVGEDNFPYFDQLSAFQLKFVIERMKQVGKR